MAGGNNNPPPLSQDALDAIAQVQSYNQMQYQNAQNNCYPQNMSLGAQLGQQGQATIPRGPSLDFVFDMVMAGVEKNLRRIIREELAKDREEEVTRLAQNLSGEDAS